MNRTIIIFLLSFSVMFSAASAAEWELVFSDEFNYAGLPDPNKWDYEVGFIRNNESQYYTKARKENARVEDGTLIIEAIKEKFPNPAYNPNSPGRRPEFAEYTSASLNTLGKESWRYGRVEVRAKLPTGRGTWPAIWMLGTNIGQVGWPTCGEIDIMENVGFDPNRIHGSIHTQDYNHVKGTGKSNTVEVDKPYDNFHVYAIEWFEDHIDFFIDDNKYFTFKNEGTGNAVWPYDKQLYLILNLAIGGSWGAQKGIDDSIFPQKYYIDYVRVYKSKQDELVRCNSHYLTFPCHCEEQSDAAISSIRLWIATRFCKSLAMTVMQGVTSRATSANKYKEYDEINLAANSNFM